MRSTIGLFADANPIYSEYSLKYNDLRSVAQARPIRSGKCMTPSAVGRRGRHAGLADAEPLAAGFIVPADRQVNRAEPLASVRRGSPVCDAHSERMTLWPKTTDWVCMRR